jgi:RNA polymerase sigma-B factor
MRSREPFDESLRLPRTVRGCGERAAGDETSTLFGRLRAAEPGSEMRRTIRNRLVVGHMHMAERIARQFRGRGEPVDDLLQVAVMGLIGAVDRFDGARGVEFPAFAEPTIIGVIKRHFRDHAWLMGVPRRLKQLHRPLDCARVEFAQHHGRAPTVGELAARLHVSVRDIVETLEIANAYTTLSLDGAAFGDCGDQASLTTRLGIDDAALEAVEHRESLRSFVRSLPSDEQMILFLRFFRDQTQTQIAAHLGISQARVSRQLSSALTRLRNHLRDR